MSSAEKFARAEDLRRQADAAAAEAMKERQTELAQKPLLERLIFAAFTRCPCGAGLAYDPADTGEGTPFRGPSAWDCSAIILGTAIPDGKPGAVEHTGRLPFAFYEIKSEDQPSAQGATTRPTP